MSNALPNGKRKNLSDCIVNRNMAAVHTSRVVLSYGGGVGDYWDAISIKEFYQNVLIWFDCTVKYGIGRSMKRPNRGYWGKR